jgi:hypothetical protein
MKFKGLKIGLVFFVLSILLTLTFVGPVFIPIFAEGIGKSIDELFNIGNISGTTFYTCVTVCILCFLIYIFTLFKYRQNSLASLTMFFISIFIFLNAALFYYSIRFPDSHIDGQQAFDSIGKPIETCLLYLAFGLGHDFFMNKHNKTNKNSGEIGLTVNEI